MSSLYLAFVGDAVLKPLCGGNVQEEEQETCVTAARIPGFADAFLLGDSKLPGVALRFTGAELRAVGIDTSRI
ncbi:hypothetical protein [Sinosporangium siamense]|uniref:Uncharacterized protein n=1 Tax=Sinosporangium siamense TaxID=1367973 RepID=A0A919RJD9_9ACTN|nr:hypothetical protein [Sinosporangium siamense]GII94347.1 hypothetical protein Ssi02_45780 [Sinosporangium siamense]